MWTVITNFIRKPLAELTWKKHFILLRRERSFEDVFFLSTETGHFSVEWIFDKSRRLHVGCNLFKILDSLQELL
jgi:hypothetical protein